MSDVPLILFHANCADGFAAAWSARHRFHDAAEYVPVSHGAPPPDVSGREVFILDFSYKRPATLAMLAACRSLTVIDHHRSAEQELAPLAGVPRLTLVLDVGKSGGRLAWEFFHPGEPAPWLIEWTEDRDLWLWRLPESREVSAYLASHPFDFALWDRLAQVAPDSDRWERLVHEGAGILRYQAQKVSQQVRHAREMVLDGHKVLAVNATHLTSEIAGELAIGRPFGVCFFLRGDGKVVWSLRSRDGGVDVSEVARRRGGGGHPRAAGFETERVTP